MSNPYSDKDFTGQDLSGRDDMDNLFIEGSCFAQQIPNTESLPSSLTGTTFYYCNLDNVKIPAGNTVISCSTRKIKTFDDGLDWLVDDDLNQISPL